MATSLTRARYGMTYSENFLCPEVSNNILLLGVLVYNGVKKRLKFSRVVVQYKNSEQWFLEGVMSGMRTQQSCRRNDASTTFVNQIGITRHHSKEIFTTNRTMVRLSRKVASNGRNT